MRRSHVLPALLPLIVLTVATVMPSAARAQFSPDGRTTIDNTVTVAQTLATGTGTIAGTGSITIASGTAVPVTLSGTGTTLVNNGTIRQNGTGRALASSGTNAGLTIQNNAGALIFSANNDTVAAGTGSTTVSSVALTNAGTIQSAAGGPAINFRGVTGTNTINNSGFLLATGSDAVRPGLNGIVTNTGTIRATPVQSGSPSNASGSDGIDAGTITGVQVTNSGTIEGRHGITGGATTFTISVTNQNGGTISGVNGSGINIDGVATTSVATVLNQAGATITGNWDGVSANGDGDGVDVDGVLNLTNRGIIRALGANGVGSDGLPNGPDGVAAGGGTITNETGAEITAAITRGNATTSQAILVDNSSRGNAIAATTVTNRGLIRSDNGAAIVLIGTFANTVTNDTGGTIRGAGAAAVGAAIQTGNGNDTLTNRGAIVAATNGLAVDLQGGNNTLNIEGGAASIVGNVSGGTGGTNALNITPGSGNAFSYAGSFSNFATVQVNAGTTTLSGDSTYAGTTNVANGGTLIAANVAANGGSATGSGAVTVQNGGTLAGTGRIAGTVTLAPGALLSPSNRDAMTPGRLTLGGDLNVTGGSRFAFTLGGTAAGSDSLAVSGAVNFTAGSGPLVFDVLDGGGLTTGRYELISFGSANGLAMGDLSFGTTPAGFNGTFDLTGTSLGLTVTTVPEPTTEAALLVGSLALGAGAWLKRRRGSTPATVARG